jgi:hypothetical protein
MPLAHRPCVESYIMETQAAVAKPTVRQHYLPACYLARFTSQGKRDSPVNLFSLTEAKSRKACSLIIGLAVALTPDYASHLYKLPNGQPRPRW